MAAYHLPVLAQEVRDMLLLNPGGNYLDGTLGGGGHALFFMEKLTEDACYIGIDRDGEAIAFARERLKAYSNVVLYRGVFSDIEAAMREAQVDALDGVLLDLGVSSHQIDADARGFAFREGVPLDMRMDSAQDVSAADILADYSEEELSRIFREFGEERRARCIARAVVRQRQNEALLVSDQLMAAIRRCVSGKFLTKSYARIFQALRIEVNAELQILEHALHTAVDCLKPGGRIGVIAYHSLEDRIVKHFFREQENPCTCPPELPYCVCGKTPRLKRVKPFLIVPQEEEIQQNPRARSAHFRVGEKI